MAVNAASFKSVPESVGGEGMKDLPLGNGVSASSDILQDLLPRLFLQNNTHATLLPLVIEINDSSIFESL
jgi:hypothetical protein